MPHSALQGEELKKACAQLDGWTLVDEQRIEKEYKFKDFAEALAFVNRARWPSARATIRTSSSPGAR